MLRGRVTALYEIVPVGGRARIDALRYADRSQPAVRERADETACLRLRYKQPDGDRSRLLEYPILRRSLLAQGEESADFSFAASVAAFGQKLHGGRYLGEFSYDAIRMLGEAGATLDPNGYRQQYLALVKRASRLDPSVDGPTRDSHRPAVRHRDNSFHVRSVGPT